MIQSGDFISSEKTAAWPFFTVQHKHVWKQNGEGKKQWTEYCDLCEDVLQIPSPTVDYFSNSQFKFFFILCFFTFNVHTKVINCRRKESDKDTINSLKCWRTAVPSADSWRGRCKSQMRWSTQKLASQWKSCKMIQILSFLDRIAEGNRIEKLKWKNIWSRKLCYFIALIILFC